jgi:geranylgeranylglycerol-phosphate geranylgeranyltransferase
MRLNSGLTSAAAALLTAWLATPPVPTLQMTLIACVVLALSNGGYTLNDVADRDIDKINQPGRPLPRGAIAVPQALLIGSGSLVAAVVFALPLSAWCLGLTLVDVVLLAAYAAWSKRLGILKSVIVGYLVASGFLIGAYGFERIDVVIGSLVGCAFLGTMARELVKDVQDVDGDRLHGARTPAIMFGTTATYGAAFVCLALCVVLAAIPYALGRVNDGYVALIALALIPFFVAWQLRRRSPRFCQYMIMAGSIVVLAAFGVGSF